MSNLIYEQSLELFASEDFTEQKKLYDSLLFEVNQCLKGGDDTPLVEALNLAEKNNKMAILKKKNGPTLSVSIRSLIRHIANMMIKPNVAAIIKYLSLLLVHW